MISGAACGALCSPKKEDSRMLPVCCSALYAGRFAPPEKGGSMILVNIYCMELRKSYDFKVDETMPAGKAAAEIVGMIARYEQLQSGRNDDFMLCRKEAGLLLDPEKTLAENKVRSGDDLLLV